MKTTTIFCALALICAVAVAVAQTVDPSSPCKAYPDLGVDLSTLKGQGPMGPYNFTSSNIFGPSSIYIDICGNNGVIVSGTGGPARLNGPLISTANMSGAFLDKGYMVFTYRNPNIYRRHCGPAGVSFQMEVRCDQTTSQREEFSSSGHSFCNLMVTVWTASACPALPPTVPEDTTPFTDVWQPKTICRGGFERGIDLTSLYGLSSPVFFKWNTVPGTVYPCGNPRTGSLLDIVSAKHGPVTMAKLDNLIAKNQTENGLSFTFRGTDDSAFCMRRGKPMVQVVFECPQPEDDGQQGGNDSTLEDDGDWAIKVSDLWGERCFVRVKVSTKFACPKQ